MTYGLGIKKRGCGVDPLNEEGAFGHDWLGAQASDGFCVFAAQLTGSPGWVEDGGIVKRELDRPLHRGNFFGTRCDGFKTRS